MIVLSDHQKKKKKEGEEKLVLLTTNNTPSSPAIALVSELGTRLGPGDVGDGLGTNAAALICLPFLCECESLNFFF